MKRPPLSDRNLLLNPHPSSASGCYCADEEAVSGIFTAVKKNAHESREESPGGAQENNAIGTLSTNWIKPSRCAQA
jgi:hypothetical protein